MKEFIATRDVCHEVGLSEPALRHVLRRPGAPRPDVHPSAHVFLWTRADIERLRRFLKGQDATLSEGLAASSRGKEVVSDAR